MSKPPRISLKLGSLKLADSAPNGQQEEKVEGFGTFSKKETSGQIIISEHGKFLNSVKKFN